MNPTIALQHGPLETRRHFLHHLHNLRIPDTSTSSIHCEECEGPRSQHASEKPPDHILRFHCQHICGEKAAREWLFDRNFCGECKTVLFEEAPVPNDLCNIRRTWSLLVLQNHHDQNRNEDMKQRLHRMWRKLLDDRSEAFLEGKVQAPKSAYGIYAVRTPVMRSSPTGARRVDAKVLIASLEGSWEMLFMGASGAAIEARQDSVIDAKPITGLQVPCHPLAVKLLHHMIEVLRSIDGRLGTAARLHYEFNHKFVRSEINAQWHELAKKKEAPQGFFIYQRHLVEGVIVEFTRTSNVLRQQPQQEESDMDERETCRAAI